VWSYRTRFEGVAGLVEALLEHPKRFVTVLTEKFMIYALWRGFEASDVPGVGKIVSRAKAKGWKFSEVILGVVTSPVFNHGGTEH
jgi:hypothetical protein